jgi:hypothetical protein
MGEFCHNRCIPFNRENGNAPHRTLRLRLLMVASSWRQNASACHCRIAFRS